MCENLVWIGWAFQELSFEFSGGQKPSIRGLHVTCDVHFRTWPSYSNQKSCENLVRIWLSLSRVIVSTNIKKKKKKITDTAEYNIRPFGRIKTPLVH